MFESPFKTASEIAVDIRGGRMGCLEALDFYWARVSRHNPALNAIVVSDIERARERARLADAALQRGENWGPLHGVPMTLKESFDVVGMPTTWGVVERNEEKPKADSVVTRRLRDAGAVIFGKTNVPTLLAEWQTNNPIYGATHNPWDVRLSPGGSSGGSAAALAAGLTALEVGSDIGASIRNPAHYCGVYGHKPTYGLVPLRGQLLSGNVAPVDFFVAGPLARSAVDLQLALNVIAGPDAIDAEGWRLELPPPTKVRLAEFKVALMLEDPNSAVDGAVKDGLQRLADFLAGCGAAVSDTARPDFDTTDAHRTFITLLRAATSRSQSDEAYRRNAVAATKTESDDSYFARMVRANTMSHKDWLDADEARHRLRHKWHAFFVEYDFLLCPAAASAAHPPNHIGERHLRTITVDGKQVSVIDQLFWAGIAGLANLPATVAPVGLTPAGLPTGVQIIGGEYRDRSCIGFAGLLEQEFYAFTPPPDFAQ
jgi:amidase